MPVPPPLPPEQGQGLWEQYAEGLPPLPRQSQEAELKLAYFQLGNTTNRRWRALGEVAGYVSTGAAASVGAGTPGAAIAADQFGAMLLVAVTFNGREFSKDRTFFRGQDPGPVAAGILAARLARQAVAESPADPASMPDS